MYACVWCFRLFVCLVRARACVHVFLSLRFFCVFMCLCGCTFVFPSALCGCVVYFLHSVYFVLFFFVCLWFSSFDYHRRFASNFSSRAMALHRITLYRPSPCPSPSPLFLALQKYDNNALGRRAYMVRRRRATTQDVPHALPRRHAGLHHQVLHSHSHVQRLSKAVPAFFYGRFVLLPLSCVSILSIFLLLFPGVLHCRKLHR